MDSSTNSSEGAIDINGDGGILKKILREGTGDHPPEGSNVKVHYVGTLQSNGEKFDSSRARGNHFTFKIGKGQVIKGWDQGVATMKQGELSILTCRSDYAYGDDGSPPTIPGKATLNFEVELFGWEDPEPESFPDKIKAALKRKDEGNDLYKVAKYSEASSKYQTAVDYFKQSWGLKDDEKKQVDDIKLPCLLNLAACQSKTQDYSECILTCSKVLDIDSKNVKALYRRGQAHSLSGEFEKAKEDLDEALQYSPKNADIRAEHDKLKKKIKEYKDKEKQMFSGVFSKMKANSTTSTITSPETEAKHLSEANSISAADSFRE